MTTLPLLPDAKRIELIKRGVDKMAFGGVGSFIVFLLLPKVPWDLFFDLSPFGMLAVMVGSLAPFVFLLIWIEQKTRSRKIWWTVGGLAWFGLFALALSGYHLR